jgi:hypothetical protein
VDADSQNAIVAAEASAKLPIDDIVPMPPQFLRESGRRQFKLY